MSATKHPESAVLCTWLQSESLVKPLGERESQVALSGRFRGVASEFQITLAHLRSLMLTHEEKTPLDTEISSRAGGTPV